MTLSLLHKIENGNLSSQHLHQVARDPVTNKLTNKATLFTVEELESEVADWFLVEGSSTYGRVVKNIFRYWWLAVAALGFIVTIQYGALLAGRYTDDHKLGETFWKNWNSDYKRWCGLTFEEVYIGTWEVPQGKAYHLIVDFFALAVACHQSRLKRYFFDAMTDQERLRFFDVGKNAVREATSLVSMTLVRAANKGSEIKQQVLDTTDELILHRLPEEFEHTKEVVENLIKGIDHHKGGKEGSPGQDAGRDSEGSEASEGRAPLEAMSLTRSEVGAMNALASHVPRGTSMGSPLTYTESAASSPSSSRELLQPLSRKNTLLSRTRAEWEENGVVLAKKKRDKGEEEHSQLMIHVVYDIPRICILIIGLLALRDVCILTSSYLILVVFWMNFGDSRMHRPFLSKWWVMMRVANLIGCIGVSFAWTPFWDSEAKLQKDSLRGIFFLDSEAEWWVHTVVFFIMSALSEMFRSRIYGSVMRGIQMNIIKKEKMAEDSLCASWKSWEEAEEAREKEDKRMESDLELTRKLLGQQDDNDRVSDQDLRSPRDSKKEVADPFTGVGFDLEAGGGASVNSREGSGQGAGTGSIPIPTRRARASSDVSSSIESSSRSSERGFPLSVNYQDYQDQDLDQDARSSTKKHRKSKASPKLSATTAPNFPQSVFINRRASSRVKQGRIMTMQGKNNRASLEEEEEVPPVEDSHCTDIIVYAVIAGCVGAAIGVIILFVAGDISKTWVVFLSAFIGGCVGIIIGLITTSPELMMAIELTFKSIVLSVKILLYLPSSLEKEEQADAKRNQDESLKAGSFSRLTRRDWPYFNIVIDKLIKWLEQKSHDFYNVSRYNENMQARNTEMELGDSEKDQSQGYALLDVTVRAAQYNLHALVWILLCFNASFNPSLTSFFPVFITFVWGITASPSPPTEYWASLNLYFSLLITIKFFFYLRVWCTFKEKYETWSSDSQCPSVAGLTYTYDEAPYIWGIWPGQVYDSDGTVTLFSSARVSMEVTILSVIFFLQLHLRNSGLEGNQWQLFSGAASQRFKAKIQSVNSDRQLIDAKRARSKAQLLVLFVREQLDNHKEWSGKTKALETNFYHLLELETRLSVWKRASEEVLETEERIAAMRLEMEHFHRRLIGPIYQEEQKLILLKKKVRRLRADSSYTWHDVTAESMLIGDILDNLEQDFLENRLHVLTLEKDKFSLTLDTARDEILGIVKQKMMREDHDQSAWKNVYEALDGAWKIEKEARHEDHHGAVHADDSKTPKRGKDSTNDGLMHTSSAPTRLNTGPVKDDPRDYALHYSQDDAVEELMKLINDDDDVLKLKGMIEDTAPHVKNLALAEHKLKDTQKDVKFIVNTRLGEKIVMNWDERTEEYDEDVR